MDITYSKKYNILLKAASYLVEQNIEKGMTQSTAGEEPKTDPGRPCPFENLHRRTCFRKLLL